MLDINQFLDQFPDYKEVPAEDLASALYAKYYSMRDAKGNPAVDPAWFRAKFLGSRTMQPPLPEPTPEPPPETDIDRYGAVGDVLKGTLETAASLATALPAYGMGALAGALTHAFTGGRDDLSQKARDWTQETFTYQPTSESGKGAVEIAGNALSLPYMPAEWIREQYGFAPGYAAEMVTNLLIPKVAGAVKGGWAEMKAKGLGEVGLIGGDLMASRQALPKGEYPPGSFSDLYDRRVVTEIPDKGLKFLKKDHSGPMFQAVRHDKAFYEYPQLADANLYLSIDPRNTPSGGSSLTTPKGPSFTDPNKPYIRVIARNTQEAKQMWVEETDHLIGALEGRSPGSSLKIAREDFISAKTILRNPERYPPEKVAWATKVYEIGGGDSVPMTEAGWNEAAWRIYESNAGEARGKAAASRSGMTPEQLSKSHYSESYPIPPDQWAETGDVMGLPKTRRGTYEHTTYHGTTKPIEGTFRGAEEDSMRSTTPDRLLGPHFATDPTIANRFTGEKGKRSYGNPTIPVEGSAVYPADIPSETPGKVYTVHQPTYPSSGSRMSDQTAISSDMARVVFPERPDLFKAWIKRARGVSDKMADEVYNKIKNGESIPDEYDHFVSYVPDKITDPWGKMDFGSYQYNFDSMFLMAPEIVPEIVREYRNILRKQGYEAVKYENTAPMEIEGAANRDAYISLAPEKLQTPWEKAAGEGKEGYIPGNPPNFRLLDPERALWDRSFPPQPTGEPSKPDKVFATHFADTKRGAPFDTLRGAQDLQEAHGYSTVTRQMINESTPEYPYHPVTHALAPYTTNLGGRINPVNKKGAPVDIAHNPHYVAQGLELDLNKIYDTRSDPKGFLAQAEQIMRDKGEIPGANPGRFRDIYSDLIYKDGYEGFYLQTSSSPFDENILLYNERRAQKPVESSIAISNQVQGVSTPMETFQEVFDAHKAGLGEQLYDYSLEESKRFHGVKVEGYDPQAYHGKWTAADGGVSEGAEGSIALRVSGPPTAVEAYAAWLALVKGQNAVGLIRQVGVDTPATGVRVQFALKSKDGKYISEAGEKHSINELNLYTDKNGVHYIDTVVESTESAEGQRLLDFYSSEGTGGITYTDVNSTYPGKNDFPKIIGNYFGKKGQEVYFEGFKKGQEYTASLRRPRSGSGEKGNRGDIQGSGGDTNTPQSPPIQGGGVPAKVGEGKGREGKEGVGGATGPTPNPEAALWSQSKAASKPEHKVFNELDADLDNPTVRGLQSTYENSIVRDAQRSSVGQAKAASKKEGGVPKDSRATDRVYSKNLFLEATKSLTSQDTINTPVKIANGHWFIGVTKAKNRFAVSITSDQSFDYRKDRAVRQSRYVPLKTFTTVDEAAFFAKELNRLNLVDKIADAVMSNGYEGKVATERIYF